MRTRARSTLDAAARRFAPAKDPDLAEAADVLRFPFLTRSRDGVVDSGGRVGVASERLRAVGTGRVPARGRNLAIAVRPRFIWMCETHPPERTAMHECRMPPVDEYIHHRGPHSQLMRHLQSSPSR